MSYTVLIVVANVSFSSHTYNVSEDHTTVLILERFEGFLTKTRFTIEIASS